ncbi:MAG: hypothetical protein JO011_11620 [Ktedonobacteraceae bacterium]|nr:hypothetical protein [Ktedonobacteraceae bacterium]
MSMLIVVGLMAFGLLAISTAVFLAMGENKTPSASTTAPSKTASSTTTTPQPVAESASARISEQRLPTIREKTQVTAITTQFSELTAQLRSLHEQAREVERRLSILSDIAEQIEFGKSRVSIEETEDYVSR